MAVCVLTGRGRALFASPVSPRSIPGHQNVLFRLTLCGEVRSCDSHMKIWRSITKGDYDVEKHMK